MNDLKINNLKIEEMIYEIRGKQVMLDKDVSVTKCNGNMVKTYDDIGKPISSCNYNFADTSAKLLR